MTIDHPIRRLLARCCSADTMARVVDPTLADIRWEHGRPTVLSYLVLLRALTVHAVLSLPGVAVRLYSDDDRAIPRAAGLGVICALVAALPFVALPFIAIVRQVAKDPAWTQLVSVEACLLLLPQAIVLTLPAGLLLAFPLAFRGRERTRALTRRAIFLASVFVVATGAVTVWGVPSANQAFRVLMINGRGHLTPGPAEMGFVALRERIAVLNLTPGGQVAARPLEFLYQTRVALIAAPLPLGVVALGLASMPIARRRPWLIGTGAVIAYMCILFPLYMAAALLMRVVLLPPAVFAWLPTAATIVSACVISSRRT